MFIQNICANACIHNNWCRYNAVQYNTLFNTSLQWLNQDTNYSLNPQKTSHTSPWRARYGVYFVIVLKNDRVITGPHCISSFVAIVVPQYVGAKPAAAAAEVIYNQSVSKALSMLGQHFVPELCERNAALELGHALTLHHIRSKHFLTHQLSKTGIFRGNRIWWL